LHPALEHDLALPDKLRGLIHDGFADDIPTIRHPLILDFAELVKDSGGERHG
jgi:hypothetical protein